MRGIQIRGGALFIEHEGITVRVMPDGTCDLSPVLLMALEWELHTEPPQRWDYLTESQIKALDHGVYEQVLAVVKGMQVTLEE